MLQGWWQNETWILTAGQPRTYTISHQPRHSHQTSTHRLTPQMLQALREALEAASSTPGSTGESIRENLVQVRWCMCGAEQALDFTECCIGLRALAPCYSPAHPPCSHCRTPCQQIIGCVGSRMRSHHAHQLLLGIMITQVGWGPAMCVGEVGWMVPTGSCRLPQNNRAAGWPCRCLRRLPGCRLYADAPSFACWTSSVRAAGPRAACAQPGCGVSPG